jgi:type IV pilus biogenesis protein CpaD/CtpE
MITKNPVVLALMSVLLLSGCSVESETWVNSDRVEVHDDQFTDTFDTAKMDDGTFHAIGDYFSRYGNGEMNVVVSFDPQSKTNTESKAQAAMASIQSGLSRNGISRVHSALSPMRGSGDISTTLISFPALTAAAPSGCGMMPGYENTATDIQGDSGAPPKYKFGCSVESLLAKQVARPSDLLGKQGFETNADGRRQERVLSTRGYYGDKSNTPLEGESASKN